MKRFAVIACAAVLAAACGSKSPTTPTPNPNQITFKATLSPANEVPPVSNADQGASGTATVTLNVVRDAANTITGGNIAWTYSVSGFPAGTQLILNHIHEAGPGVNGGVVINSGLSAAAPLTLAAGTLTNQAYVDLNANAVAVYQRMIDNPNGFYFNVHSTLNPGGAVRGQLVKQ